MDNLFTNILNRLKGAREEAKELQKTNADQWASLNLKKGIDASIIIVTEEINSFKESDRYDVLSQVMQYFEHKGIQVREGHHAHHTHLDCRQAAEELSKLVMVPQCTSSTELVSRDDVIDEFVAECESDTVARTFGLRICDIHRIADKLKNKEVDEDE